MSVVNGKLTVTAIGQDAYTESLEGLLENIGIEADQISAEKLAQMREAFESEALACGWR